MKLKGLLEDYSEYNVVDKEALLMLLKKPKKSVYDLEKGDEVWILFTDGEINLKTWDGFSVDRCIRDRCMTIHIIFEIDVILEIVILFLSHSSSSGILKYSINKRFSPILLIATSASL